MTIAPATGLLWKGKMKLRNKKTGEIAVCYVMVGIQNNEKYPNPIEYHTYGSIAELNAEWCDADDDDES